MKQAVTIRIAPEVLASARERAKQENRSLTNFIETALKERLGAFESQLTRKRRFDGRKGSPKA